MASYALVRDEGASAVGIEINGSHMRGVTEGMVTGVCRPLRLGRSLHFYRPLDGCLISISRQR